MGGHVVMHHDSEIQTTFELAACVALPTHCLPEMQQWLQPCCSRIRAMSNIHVHCMQPDRKTGAADGACSVADPEAAQRLDLPPFYEPRFRVNCAVVGDKERLRAAARAIDRRLARQQPPRQLKGAQVGEMGLLWCLTALVVALCTAYTLCVRLAPSRLVSHW